MARHGANLEDFRRRSRLLGLLIVMEPTGNMYCHDITGSGFKVYEHHGGNKRIINHSRRYEIHLSYISTPHSYPNIGIT